MTSSVRYGVIICGRTFDGDDIVDNVEEFRHQLRESILAPLPSLEFDDILSVEIDERTWECERMAKCTVCGKELDRNEWSFLKLKRRADGFMDSVICGDDGIYRVFTVEEADVLLCDDCNYWIKGL